MRLGTRGRYAVTALVDIATHGSNGIPVPLSAIAVRQGMSLPYLEQLFVSLRRANLVQSLRGPGGGYRLRRGSDEITIEQVLRAVAEPLSATACEDDVGTGCGGGGRQCLTHDLWEGLSAKMHVFLQQTTLADVVHRRVVPCPAVAEFAVNSGTVLDQLTSVP